MLKIERKGQRGWMNPRKLCLPDTTGLTHMSTSETVHRAQDLSNFKPDRIPALRGGS